MRIDLKDYQQIYIEHFFKILDFFDSHRINYSLAFGTMLGAYREQDIIPWDFDIDILIEDEDVKNNLQIFRKFNNEEFYFKSYLTDQLQYGLSRFYIKGLKITRNYMKENPYYDAYIDVYHFRRMKKNYRYNKKTIKRIKKYMFIQSIKYDLDFSKNPLKRLAKKIYVNFIPNYDIFKIKYEKIVSKIQSPDPYSIIILFPDSLLRDFPRDDYGYKNILFHNRECKCFKSINSFLTTEYGKDYMTPKDDGRLTSDMEFEFERN